MEQENWFLQLIASSPVFAAGFGIGAGILAALWWLGGQDEAEDVEDEEKTNPLDETIDFELIDAKIQFHKEELILLQEKRKNKLTNEELLKQMQDILEEMKNLRGNPVPEEPAGSPVAEAISD